MQRRNAPRRILSISMNLRYHAPAQRTKVVMRRGAFCLFQYTAPKLDMTTCKSVVMRRGAFCLFQCFLVQRIYRFPFGGVVMRRGAFCLFQCYLTQFLFNRFCRRRNAPRRILSISIIMRLGALRELTKRRNAPRRILSISIVTITAWRQPHQHRRNAPRRILSISIKAITRI